MADRIKELARKKNGAFPDMIPLGADSKFVDMLDGQTLEEEFKLTGPCITEIGQDASGQMLITEEFRVDSQTTDYYKVITTFETSSAGMTITQVMHYIDDTGTDNVIRTKTVTFESSSSGMIIKEV